MTLLPRSRAEDLDRDDTGPQASPLDLEVVGQNRRVQFRPASFVMAMYTGCDAATVQKHIDELAEEGVAPPDSVPMFVDLPVGLLTTAASITVVDDETSGEVEPVLLCTPDGAFLGVGSDHTARGLERDDMLASKKACAKVLAPRVVPLETAVERWETAVLRSWAGSDERPLQDAGIRSIRPVSDLVSLLAGTGRATESLVMFLGTVPQREPGFVFAPEYRVELDLGDGTSIAWSYTVRKGDLP